MRISAKCRYGIAGMTYMAMNYNNGCITIISIAERLGISKIYLEQVFSLLKRSGLVISIKGAQGGYQLANSPKDITLYEIISAIETSLFEKTENTLADNIYFLNDILEEEIFMKLDLSIENILKGITLQSIAEKAIKNAQDDNFMFYI